MERKLWLIVLVLDALLIFATGGTASGQAGSPTLVTRFTNAYPAYSPDGSKIAFMSNADGDFNIYVIEPAAGTIVKLTDAPGQDGTPVWSPDGMRIAFRSFRDGPSQIYVMDADGGNQRNLSSSPSNDEHPFWSRDGRRIYFASDRSSRSEEDENVDLYVMDADGSDVRRITSTPEVETYPAPSPDGTKLATRRILADGNWEVVVVDLDGNDIANVSNHPGFDGWPAWSPDGSRLVFASERSGSSDLWMVDADGSNLRRLTDDPADDRQAWWSPDGERIAFARYVWFPAEPLYESSEILVLELNAATGGSHDDSTIATLIEQVEDANNAGDVERWVGFFADSAVYMASGAPAVTTREGLVEVARAGFRNQASIDIEPVEILVFDDWAFARTRVTGTVTLAESGEIVPVDGKQIVIYTREADGTWRIARMISNSNSQ